MTEKMSYEEFKGIIKNSLQGSKALTWTEIRKKNPQLYQKWPANQWVTQLERDIGLIRERIKGKMVWRLN
jgi:hypothetical protein